MIDTNNIRFAGDISIEQINIVTSKGMTQNITNQVIAIDIFEDLFSPFMTGVIGVKESFDFTNLLPFIGEEFVNITLYTPSLDKKHHIDQQFYVYKISNRLLGGDRSTYYELHFISKEAIVDANKKVSKVYEGLIYDIAKDLYTNPEYGLESTKQINVERTANNNKFIANYWSPVKSLNFIAGQAVSTDGDANYLFYENRKGLNFISLGSLYKQDPYKEFVYDNYARDINSRGQTSINLAEDYKRITDIEVPVLTNYIEKAVSGMHASKIISNDILTKRYYSKNYDMLEDYVNTNHLNKFSPTTNKVVKHPNSMVINAPREYDPFNGYHDTSNVRTLQRRISQLASAQASKINITVLGRTDYTVGMKVYVTLFKVEPIKKDEALEDTIDKVLSGYYIVSAINHSINRNKHECSMELIKDSYIMDLNKGK